ncbi:unnamed protein product [Calicophoron daubneyi]|uniref:Cyclin-K n=1 Tax=Calicophoron daubneyi TaxID=300641 RepID=A0AAV2T504_CALDB
MMDDQMESHMPCWYYEREELLKTPSFLDHIDHETETRYRTEGARFLFDVSHKMNLRYDTCATAIVFFHRFYMVHSFKAFPRYVTAACCLMLAGKVEETPKKEEIMAFERVLLKTIKFDLQVSHPYSYLLQFVKRIKGDKDKLKELVQMSWSFINDSLATTLCLQWEPEIVACAVLYLATRMSKYTIEDWEGRQPGLRWWENFVEGMSTEVMEDICHKILDLYPADGGATSSSGDNSAPKRTEPSGSGPTAGIHSSLQSSAANRNDLLAKRPRLIRPSSQDPLQQQSYSSSSARPTVIPNSEVSSNEHAPMLTTSYTAPGSLPYIGRKPMMN